MQVASIIYVGQGFLQWIVLCLLISEVGTLYEYHGQNLNEIVQQVEQKLMLSMFLVQKMEPVVLYMVVHNYGRQVGLGVLSVPCQAGHK